MHPKSTAQADRRIRARNLVLIGIFVSVFGISAATNPSADGVRPFMLTLALTICAKSVTEYLFGLPMRFLHVQLQPSERSARLRVLVGMFAIAAFTIYLFYFGPQGHA
jgi:hypothetical protein